MFIGNLKFTVILLKFYLFHIPLLRTKKSNGSLRDCYKNFTIIFVLASILMVAFI